MASTVSSTALTFGMVSAPVSLKKVKDSGGDVSFSTIDPEERPVGYVWAVKSDTSGKEPSIPTDVDEIELVPFVPGDKGTLKQDTRKGVDLGGGIYREVPPETIAAINVSCAIDGINVERFIPLAEVPLERVEGCYFIAPAPKMGPAAKKPLVLLREALAQTGRAGIGKLTFRSSARQHPFVLYAKDGGLLLNTLVFAEDFAEVDEAAESLAGVEVDEKHVAMAVTLLEAQAGTADDLNALADDARPLRSELMAKLRAGEVIEAPEKAEAEPTVDLEAALIASIGAAGEAKATTKPTGKAKAKAAA